jgi:glycosyltransferase involved in cell wall biosynthesis
MTPQSILLYSEYYLPHHGGIELHVHALARRLQRSGLQVTVATPLPGPELVDRVPVHRLRVPLLPHFDTVWGTHAVRPGKALLRDGGFDLLHCHHSIYNPTASGAVYLAQRMGLPTVVTFHSILRGYTAAFALFDRLTGWSRWPVTYTAVSERVAEEISRLLGGRPVSVLPNGIEPAAWRPREPVPSRNVFRVVSSMRLVRRKRPRALVDMLALLRDRLPEGVQLQARILGRGTESDTLRRLIARRGLDAEVELCGSVTHEEMREVYARSDVFVLPSIEESFGIAALEARAAGLPVVAMRASGPAAFIRDGLEGLLADSDADMVAALVRLARDGALRLRIAQHNRTTPPPYAWDDVIALHLDTYAAAVLDANAAKGERRGVLESAR